MPTWLPLSARDTAVTAIFLVSYFVFAAGGLPGTKIGRSAMAVIGAAMMFAAGGLPGRSAIGAVNFPTLVLLFAMMIVAGGLNLSGFFDWIAALVATRVRPDQLLPAVIFASGILSAFLINDVVCLVLAPLVLAMAKALRRDPVIYLLGLATASNIGSLATLTGNPQDILIGTLSGIGYVPYLLRLAPVAVIGLFVDWGCLHWLERPRPSEPVNGNGLVAGAAAGSGGTGAAVARGAAHFQRGMLPALIISGLVILGFLLGVPPALAAAVGAALLLVSRSREAEEFYAQVDWGLLLLFAGLFLIIGGAQNARLLYWLSHWGQSSALRNPAVFTAFAAVLSNIVSNVPAVMLLKGPMAHLGSQRYWLLLAMASTLAGNLTLTGSVANFIVAERARPEARLGFWRYLRVGFPVAVITIVLGYVLLAFGL